MLNKLKKYFTTITKVCVLEQVTFADSISYYFVEISLKKDTLKIVRNIHFTSISDFKFINKKKLPVILNLSGINVLVKTNSTNLDSFSKEEFFMSQYEIESNTYTNIIRKETALEILSLINENKFLLLGIEVGCHQILKHIKTLELSDISYEPHTFEKSNDSFEYSFQENKTSNFQKIFIGKTNIDSCFVSSICVAIDFLVIKQFEDSKNKGAVIEGLFAQVLPKLVVSGVASLFLVLLLNQLFQIHLSKKYEDSEVETTFLQKQKNKLENLKQEIEQKELVFEEVGLQNSGKMAQYSDIIAGLIPNNIILDEMVISPISKKLKNDEKVILESKIILISGESDNIETLNDFLIKIESNSLFSQAKIVEFKEAAGSSVFKLEINL